MLGLRAAHRTVRTLGVGPVVLIHHCSNGPGPGGRARATPSPAGYIIKPSQVRSGQVRSGQVYYTAEIQDHEGQAKETPESEQNEGAEMSNLNELVSGD